MRSHSDTEDADVAVIGVGAMGSMALWQLAERGVRAIGFEQFEPGHDRGSSHGESRIIRTAAVEDPRYVLLAQRAIALWRELEHQYSVRLLTVTGVLFIGPPDGAIVTGALRSIRAHRLDHQILDQEEMRRRYPQHRLNPGDIAVYDPAGGVLLPEACILAAVRRAEALGVRLLRDTRVERVERVGDAVEVSAGTATYRVRKVIVSVGAWLGPFLPDLALPVSVARQVLVWCPVPDAEPFRPDRFPVFLRDIGDGHSQYGLPTLDGQTIKLAVRQEGDATTADALDRRIHESDLIPVQKFADRYLAGVEPHASRAQVCMYTNTPDRNFLIGTIPDRPWMLVLGGFSGHGFKYSSAIGAGAASWAATGRLDPSFDFLTLGRFPRAHVEW